MILRLRKCIPHLQILHNLKHSIIIEIRGSFVITYFTINEISINIRKVINSWQ